MHELSGIFCDSDQDFALPRIVAAWLFEINVLAGFGGEGGHGRVPMIGSGDEQGINLLVFQYAAEVLFGHGRVTLGLGGDVHGFRQIADVHVDDVFDFDAWHGGEFLDQIQAAAMNAGDADDDPVSRGFRCTGGFAVHEGKGGAGGQGGGGKFRGSWIGLTGDFSNGCEHVRTTRDRSDTRMMVLNFSIPHVSPSLE